MPTYFTKAPQFWAEKVLKSGRYNLVSYVSSTRTISAWIGSPPRYNLVSYIPSTRTFKSEEIEKNYAIINNDDPSHYAHVMKLKPKPGNPVYSALLFTDMGTELGPQTESQQIFEFLDTRFKWDQLKKSILQNINL